MVEDDDPVYGTASEDAPVPRADFERALRRLNVTHQQTRDQLLQLAAQVIALTDELARRDDALEPALAAALPETLREIRGSDARYSNGVEIDLSAADKYETVTEAPPCAELIHLCGARCCSLEFALSTQDLDEGIIRWDYGRPYMIRQRASDKRCVHNDPDTLFCTVHAARPHVCRSYHCKDDPRIWIDYEARIPQPYPNDKTIVRELDLIGRARARSRSLAKEDDTLMNTYPDAAPRRGPRPG